MSLLLAACALTLLQDSAPEGAPAPLHERLQSQLAAYVAAARVPGLSVGVATARESLALAAGRRDRRAEAALEPTDLLCAGSTGKTFVAAVVLQLVAEQKLTLDTLAGELLGDEPWFEDLPNAGELSVRTLLAHRTGLPRYEFQPAFGRDLLAQKERVWRPEELLAYVSGHAPAFAVDEGFTYSDTNYIVLGLLVERAAGASLYAEVARRLLTPLGLEHVRPQDGRRIHGLVQGHAGAHDPLGFPEYVLDEDGLFCTNPQFEWAGGGFVTNGGDLARWARALYGGDVLSRELRTKMTTSQPAPELGRDVGYGLGAITWKTPHGPAVGHEGFFPGYTSCVRYWPEHDVAVAVQVNTSDFKDLPRPLGRLCEELLVLTLAP
ncbi:MAG: serine hydrolase domain-containing protein [Planctomycetota bacterium]